MNLPAFFIKRPVATTLMVLAILLAGGIAFRALPVASLPQVDFATITVASALPGASPEVMASSVATPLERQFGHIAGVTQMTSTSTLGATGITLQFDYSRDVDGAARDVQAAINAARTYLPANLPTNPTYRKVNSAVFPVMVLAMTSKTHSVGDLFDTASSVVQQKLSQVEGVGQVQVVGGALPAVRVQLNPQQLASYGLGPQDVANVLAGQNSNRPKGQISNAFVTADITANDQISKAKDYQPIVVSSKNGSVVRLSDIAQVTDSIQTTRAAGFTNGKPSVVMLVYRLPNANVIDVADRLRKELKTVNAIIPAGDSLEPVIDTTTTIRASVSDVERTMVIATVLVVAVVFVFLRSPQATLIPAVAVTTSLIGTFTGMYLLGFSVNNLSLMALTVSTGFVVDDAIVVMENITRLIEDGISPWKAAIEGAREVSFTVLSMSLSLIAVFIPLLLMGGLIGRLFHEFAMTLCLSIAVSMFISLTTTPMMCVYLLKPASGEAHGRFYRMSENAFAWLLEKYRVSLTWTLRHPKLVLLTFFLTIVANAPLLYVVPKGLFPTQDTGLIFGGLQGSQDASFHSMRESVLATQHAIMTDPAVQTVAGFTGGPGGASNSGFIFLSLKPLDQRNASASGVLDRLRPKLNALTGASSFLQAAQDLGAGGRQSNAQYQYQISADTVEDLGTWGPRLYQEMRNMPSLKDVTTDQQNGGLQMLLNYDRATAARFGITPQLIDQSLYYQFGESQVSTIYTSLNQYYVVMEAAPQFYSNPATLRNTFVHASGSSSVPLQAFATSTAATSPLSVNHSSFFPSVTISFNLAAGASLSEAIKQIDTMRQRIGAPGSVRGQFAGTAEVFLASLSTEPMLILASLLSIYIVLGVLYESFIHPITILTTLPSAGVGALFALLICGSEFDVISVIGVFLLIGIVKKNAILMIDFALLAERDRGMTTEESIFEAAILRFRPILMTTLAAFFGAIPLAIGTGVGAELRRPLGIAICGGLLFSQVLTLYTTPVIYLYFDHISQRFKQRRAAHSGAEILPAN
jgi:multidrug efflux pump